MCLFDLYVGSYCYNFDSNYWSAVYKRTYGKDFKFKAGYDSEVRLGWASLWVKCSQFALLEFMADVFGVLVQHVFFSLFVHLTYGALISQKGLLNLLC